MQSCTVKQFDGANILDLQAASHAIHPCEELSCSRALSSYSLNYSAGGQLNCKLPMTWNLCQAKKRPVSRFCDYLLRSFLLCSACSRYSDYQFSLTVDSRFRSYTLEKKLISLELPRKTTPTWKLNKPTALCWQLCHSKSKASRRTSSKARDGMPRSTLYVPLCLAEGSLPGQTTSPRLTYHTL